MHGTLQGPRYTYTYVGLLFGFQNTIPNLPLVQTTQWIQWPRLRSAKYLYGAEKTTFGTWVKDNHVHPRDLGRDAEKEERWIRAKTSVVPTSEKGTEGSHAGVRDFGQEPNRTHLGRGAVWGPEKNQIQRMWTHHCQARELAEAHPWFCGLQVDTWAMDLFGFLFTEYS